MDASLDIVDRYGLPLVILSLIAIGVWRAWRFVQPYIRDTLDEHIQLIKELRDGSRVNTLSLKKQSDAMSAHAEALTLNTAFLRKIYDSILTKPRPAPNRPLTLMVVEDSPTDYLLLRKQLEPLANEERIELLHAATLAEALRQLDLVDGIILDMLLPDANDPRTNRLFAELAQLPVILHTSSQDEIADKLAQRIGAQIVRKDQPPEVLEAAVKRMIEGIKG